MINKMRNVMSSKAWDIIWLVCGWTALIVATLLPIIQGTGNFDIWVGINLIGAILAPLIVNLMANQKVKLGTGMGIVGAGLDAANYFRLGIIGSVMTAIWAFITYVKGFITFSKKDEFKASKTSKKDLLSCAIVAVISCSIVVWLYYFVNPSILPSLISS